jgi:signal transduction histidine kinase
MQGPASTPLVFLILSTILLLALASFFTILVVVFNKNIKNKQLEIYRTMLETQENEQQRIGQDLHE